MDADAKANTNANANANANTGGSTIALCERCSGELKRIGSKTTKKGGDIIFPIISQWDFLLPWKQRFDPICPKSLCSLSPTPVMLHIKFDQVWPTGFRDKVWMMTMDDDAPMTDHWYTISFGFGSGELKGCLFCAPLKIPHLFQWNR